MRVLTTTPFLNAAPGESVTCRLRIENDGRLPANYRLRIVGFDDDHVVLPATNGALAAGDVTDVDVLLTIPDAFAPGNHAIGVEVSSDRKQDSGSVAAVTVSVGSVARLLMTVTPSTVRGHRRAKFSVDVLNRDDETMELDLAGEAPGVSVRIKPNRVSVAPNARVRARGKVTGRVHLFGEPRQQPFTVTARSRSAPTYAPATYQQRPLFPRPLRTFVALLTALAIWAGALGAGLLWWTNRGDDEAAAPVVELVDIDGDGVDDTPADQLVDTDGDGVPDTPASVVAAAVAAGGAGADSEPSAGAEPLGPTQVRGTVKAGETGQNDGVLVTLTPIVLGAAPSPQAQSFAGAGRSSVAKLWPARYGVRAEPGVSAVRQTTTVTDVSEGADGVFLFPDVLIRQTYEVNFAKAGFDSQSFVVTPPESGDPVEMEVVLEPSNGALGGTVSGPGGPLGNVDIEATDGTLVYRTSSSSEAGAAGRFSLPAINTPATYTITATLRGYGTEVIQVPLDPGEQRTDLSINMRPGVGSIIGRVTSGGAPLGGVTLTASGGDITRTTTSLTEGDTGLYTFPQLDVPETYTVTASAEGYITQTRLVTLAGNVTDVDFDLVKTTAAITGLVVSNVRGPLPGATITITRDDLTFTASSAAAPQPGAFTVDDLPPGTYLVRFSRFDHAEASQLVTLAAGETRDLGRIELVFTDVPVLPSTGSVNVTVTDSQGAPLRGATVRLIDVSNGQVVATLDDPDENQSTFLFENVTVGTYTVQVERRLYRTAQQRVSVGLGPQAVTVTMFLLGQASGRVIDSLTRQQLTNYEVSISRLNPDGTVTLVERVTVPANALPDPLTGEIRWESSPNSLTTGTYRVEITDPPPGYAVVNDQVVDPDRPASPPMQFEILPTAEDPIRLNDIEADPYPTLKGRIFKPLLAAAATNDVQFVPIDDDALAVTLSCPGAPNTVPAVLTDEDPTAPGLDTYFYDAITLESNALIGACVITVGAPGFVTASVTMDPPLLPSDGVTRSDQLVNIALVAPNDPIAGTLVWLDTGVTPTVERPIDGVTIASEGDVIIGFNRAQGTDPDALPTPLFAPGPLSSVSVGGTWRLDGQVFGQATYSFSDPARFDTGRLTVTIDETAQRQVAAVQSLVVDDRGAAGGGIHVEMEPLPGVIVGSVGITTVLPPRLSDVLITAQGPDAQTIGPLATLSGVYTISATAGTWQLAIAASGDVPATDPRDYSLAPGAVTSLTTLVNPGATTNVGATTFIEHPRIDFQIVDSFGNPINQNGVTPTITITRPGTNRSQPADPATGRTIFRRLEFAPANPLANGIQYQWIVAMPGYDLTQGTASTTLNGAIAADNSFSGSIRGSVTVRAGAKPLVRIVLPKLGSLSGNVIGRFGSRPGDPTEPIPLTDPQLSVTARRVLAFGDGPFGGRLFEPVSGPSIPAVIDPSDPAGFRVEGPPGAYVLDITHPQYSGVVARPAAPPDCPFFFDCAPGTVPRSLLGFGEIAYLVENNVDTDFVDPFVLEIRRMRVGVRVITNRTTNTPVPFVSVRLTRSTQYDIALFTGFGNTAEFVDVLPGTNEFRANTRTPTGDLNYPVIASFDVPRFSALNNGLVTVTVVMPQLGNRVGGAIGAVNSEGDPVDLPADVVIDRVFRPAPGDLDGASFDNNATEGDTVFIGVAPPSQVTITPAAPPGSPVPFEFANIAAGVHELTLTDEAGYVTPSPNPRTVTVANAAPNDLGQLDYVANNVQVVVNVTSLGAPLTTALVRLASPDVGEILVPTAGGGTYTFPAVPPELATYTLNITDDLHTAVSQPVAVVPDADGVITIDVAMTASTGRITGIAQRDPGTGPVPLAGQGSVQLQQSDGTPIGAPVTPGPSGDYQFDVTAAGDYRVSVSFAGHATRSTAVTGVTLGRVTTAPTVTIPALATATITFTGTAATEPSLTVTVTQPAASGLTPVRAGAVFTIAGLDPDVLYRFAAAANGFFPAVIPPTAPLDPTPGTTHPFTVALVERTVTVTVETEDDNTAAEAAATVQLRIPPASTTPLAPTGRTGNVYTFARIPAGAGQVTVATAGYRTQTASVPDTTTASQAVTVTLPRLVTISGTVFAAGGTTPVADVTVTANNGAVNRSTTTAANGTYSLPNLDVGTWTITTTRLGFGTASGTETVTATSASAVTRNFTLAPRNVSVAFTVNAVTPAGPLAGATVRVDGVTGTTGAAGTATVLAPENGPLVWTVTDATRITQTGTITLTAALTATVTVTLVDRPTLTGTVTRNGNNVPNATVFLCPAAAVTCDAATAAATTTSAPSTGAFTLRPDVGSWQVRAVQGGGEATVTGISVTAAGVVSPATITVALP